MRAVKGKGDIVWLVVDVIGWLVIAGMVAGGVWLAWQLARRSPDAAVDVTDDATAGAVPPQATRSADSVGLNVMNPSD